MTTRKEIISQYKDLIFNAPDMEGEKIKAEFSKILNNALDNLDYVTYNNADQDTIDLIYELITKELSKDKVNIENTWSGHYKIDNAVFFVILVRHYLQRGFELRPLDDVFKKFTSYLSGYALGNQNSVIDKDAYRMHIHNSVKLN